MHVFTGKAEIGMGVGTALAQVVAEELDVPVNHVVMVMGDTSKTADQGGVGGSTSIMLGAKPLRNASANARYLLTQMAAQRLGVPASDLEVKEGVVHVKGDASKSVSYAELAGAGDLNDTLKVSGDGFSLNVQGPGKPKDPSEYTIVGKPVPREDLAPKILGHYKYVTDVRVPGMLHGRVIRPSGVGATFVSVDESSAKAIPGFVKTVVKGNFVGVVAENEWAAIQAAKALNVTWTEPKQAFPEQQDLYAHMRSVARESQQGNAEARRRGRCAGRRREKSGGELRISVPVALHDGPGLRRRGRSPGRHLYGLVRRPETARLADGLSRSCCAFPSTRCASSG